MNLESLNGEHHEFIEVPLSFDDGTKRDVFARLKNKTVEQQISAPRYQSLKSDTMSRYSGCLGEQLGGFLLSLKENDDDFYLRFLNKNGDRVYSRFRTQGDGIHRQIGVYAYTVREELRYLGRCCDSMLKRIDNGYGIIAPKNCYKDGQSTNCHINALITESREDVRLWFCSLESENEIKETEKDLIALHRPQWNIQGC